MSVTEPMYVSPSEMDSATQNGNVAIDEQSVWLDPNDEWQRLNPQDYVKDQPGS